MSNYLWQVVKFEIFHIVTEYSRTTLRVKNSLEIALSLTVFKIFALFVFCQKNGQRNTHGGHLVFVQISRIIPKEALTMMNIPCKFGKCTLHALWYTGAAKIPKNLNETAVVAILFLETRPKKFGGKLLYHWTYPANLRPLLVILLAAEG